ncbi:MAG: DUF6345 domain-containing protein [Thainema sp.]
MEESKKLSKTQQNIPTSKESPFRSIPSEWLGGYFIVEHSICGNRDVPNADDDVWGFVNNRADWQGKNFVYANRNVWATDFQSNSDYYSVPSLPNGYDGVDAVHIAYIHTHGGTDINTNIFYLSMGGNPSHGGCQVRSQDMRLGNNKLRYLFLIACQSVQTNPIPVWGSASQGIRAFFGFHTNALDAASYGKKFFEKWKSSNSAKTTDAFLDASWDVSHEQIAVTAWCGPDLATACNYRDQETHFQIAPVTCGAMAWAHTAIRALPSRSRMASAPTAIIQFRKPEPEPHRLFRMTGRDPVATEPISQEPSSDLYECYTYGEATLLYNKASGATDLRISTTNTAMAAELSDEEAIELAQSYLQQNPSLLATIQPRAADMAYELVPVAIRDTVKGSGEIDAPENSVETRTEVTVVFRPMIGNIPTIGTGGVLEITLNGDRQVVRVRNVLREIATVERRNGEYDVSRLQAEAERRALAEVNSEPRIDRCEILKTEFGFFSADASTAQDSARLAFRILLEVQSGDFEQWIEKIYYLDDLSES